MISTMCKWLPVCPMKYYYDTGRLDEKWVRDYCFNNGYNCVRYKLEESGQYHPDNMLPDGSIESILDSLNPRIKP